jgi:hypothetical protein
MSLKTISREFALPKNSASSAAEIIGFGLNRRIIPALLARVIADDTVVDIPPENARDTR